MSIIHLIDKSHDKTVESIRKKVLGVKKIAEVILNNIDEGRYNHPKKINELRNDVYGMMDKKTQYLFAIDNLAYFFEQIASALREDQDLSFDYLAVLMWEINSEMVYLQHFVEELEDRYND